MSARALTRLLLSALLLHTACSAERHPEVLVVVNGESPRSLAIGKYYMNRRGIPVSNLVRLSIALADPQLGDARHESISREGFDERVRGPIAEFLRRRDLVDTIEIIVTTKGVPLRIEGPEVPAKTLLRDSTRASVDAELSILFSGLIGSPGVADSVNPYYDSDLSLRDFRRAHPGAPLRYLVARLTGYQDRIDQETQLPLDVRRLIDAALEPVQPESVWLIDLDPTLEPAMDAGNRVLLEPAAAGLAALSLALEQNDAPLFASDVNDIQGYASWGSNDGHDAGSGTYGEIAGRRYPGRFASRALAIDFVSTNARSFTHPPRYGQSLVADLIAGGVAGTSGHVFEPTLPAVARPHIVLRRYAEGVPAAEAFYRGIPYLGWVNVYIGDPLMRLDPAPAREDAADRDGDGIPDARDNCSALANPGQRDSDADGYGNLCDADVNGDGRVTTSWGESFPRGARGDIEWIALTASNGPYDPNYDLDGDGSVDARDVSIAQLSLFRAPGPSRR